MQDGRFSRVTKDENSLDLSQSNAYPGGRYVPQINISNPMLNVYNDHGSNLSGINH